MGFVQTLRFAHVRTDGGSPAGVAENGTLVGLGTLVGFESLRLFIPHPLPIRPFAPPELPGFLATMDALTPARRALRSVLTRESGA